MTRWEYMDRTVRSADGAAKQLSELNDLGDSGWELVAVVPRGEWTDYLFKRPVGAAQS